MDKKIEGNIEKFIWTENYCTGIEVIDNQHQELFRKFDKCSLAIYKGEGKSILREIISFIDIYVNDHFDDEERLMTINKYPDYYKHIEFHKNFRGIFNSFKKDFEQRGGDAYLALQLEKEIRNWWKNHILTIDMLYVPYIKIKSSGKSQVE